MTELGNYPMVSFVTTCYNAANFIERAVRSMQAVDWPEKEIVLVNDGSDDDTATICRRLEATSPGVSFMDLPRVGRARALNMAVGAAQGAFIAINDADDASAPHRLNVTVPYLLKHEEVGLVTTDFCSVYDADWSTCLPVNADSTRPLVATIIKPEELYRRNQLTASTMVFRKSVFDLVGGFNETLSSAIDYDFYFRVMAVAKIVKLNARTCIYQTGYEYTTFFRELKAAQKRRDVHAVLAFARERFDISMKTRLATAVDVFWGTEKKRLRQEWPMLFLRVRALKTLLRSS